MAEIEILDGDVTLFDFDENNRGAIKWTGSPTGTRSLNQLYSAALKAIDNPENMDQGVPLFAVTPTQYRGISQWFVDDETVEHFTGGSLFTQGWVSGTDEHVLVIGADFATAFSEHDIGRTIVAATTGDTGTLLDFNSQRGLLWIRPDDPSNTGDEFDNPTEAYSVQNGAFTEVWAVDDTPSDNEFIDETADANSAANADFRPFDMTAAQAIGDYCAFGFPQRFSKLVLDYANGTAGTGGVVAWDYWNGSAWVALSGVTDGTSSFTAAAADGLEVTWDAPADWQRRSINGGSQLYFVRARLTTIFSNDPHPTLDQGFIGGQGAGNFQAHGRHGGASAAGESAWAGATSIGAIQANTKAYIFREDPDCASGTFREVKVLATKGTDSWWPQEGQIDILLKTKEADSIIGPNPNAPTKAVATFFMRQYSKTYSHFIATALATAGGETVIPFGTGDDLNNTSGHRQFTTDAETGGGWGSGDVDTVIRLRGSNNAATRVWQVDADGGPGFVDETADFNSVTDNDVDLFPATEAAGDYVAFGFTSRFNKILMDNANGVAGVGGTVQWEYSTGDGTWADLETALDFSDGTSQFTTAVADGQEVRFQPPTAWTPMTINGSEQLYWVRARVTGTYSTNPVYDQGFIVEETDNHALITSVTGTGPNYTVQYYPIRTQVDYANNDVVEDEGGTKSMTLDANPTSVGPAVLSSTVTFGATTQDINNGNGARPYSSRVDPDSNPLAQVYEWQKWLTRRGSTTALQGQDGEEFLGPELQVEYSSQAGGNFAEGRKVYDQTSDAEGIIVADHDDGATGDLVLKAVRGTFTNGNVLSDSPDPTQTLGAALQVDASPFAIVDETADAQSAGGADVDPFPATEASGDYFAIGAAKPFAKVTIDIATAGVGGVGTWEYWDGAAWQTLETAPNFNDATTDLTAGTGALDLDFYPPVDWHPTTLEDGVNEFGPFYFIRLRVTTVYSTNPVLDEVTIADLVTATINGIPRTIVPVAAAPFGTFAGGKFFGAPGVTLTIANLAGGEAQAYQLIDDEGVTQIPPNTITVTVDTLVSGDAVAVYRATGGVIDKTQFVLAAGNNLGDATIEVNASIPTDNPTNAESKFRVVSSSGQEHRYRYASYAGTTFTLSAASTGTGAAGSNLTTIVDGSATFQTDGVERGDMVRNTTDGSSFSFVVSVDSETQLTVTNNGQTWLSQAYSVNTLVQNYASGDNGYVPIIERDADAATESNQLVLGSNIDYRAVVRRSSLSSPILPFTQDSTISGDTTISPTRQADAIIT